LEQRVAEIIEELTLIQNDPSKAGEGDEDFPFPRMIAAGARGSIIVSKRIDILITEVARRMLDDDPQLKLKYTQAEWRNDTRAAFGPPLAEIDLEQDLEENAKLVLGAVVAALADDASVPPLRDYVFGCTLFGDPDVASFRVGPVRFEPRLEWLARTTSSGLISTITARRVRNSWSNKKSRKRKPSWDSHDESGITDALGNVPYVCSVSTRGLAAGAGNEKALTAARLALVAIALTWRSPSSALNGMNLLYDRVARVRHDLILLPETKGVQARASRSHLPHVLGLPNGKWDEIFTENSELFAVIGECLDLIVSPTGDAQRPKLMTVFAHALLWFHEGCRESASLIAVVKFTACMDALAGGEKAGGIRRLINARLGIKDDAPIRANGPTLKQAIDRIYSQGRSRTIHGTNEEFGHDWTNTKDLSEQFARLCLVSCIGWAARNPNCDDPKQMKVPRTNPAAAH
jgi:hypothetical protein